MRIHAFRSTFVSHSCAFARPASGQLFLMSGCDLQLPLLKLLAYASGNHSNNVGLQLSGIDANGTPVRAARNANRYSNTCSSATCELSELRHDVLYVCASCACRQTSMCLHLHLHVSKTRYPDCMQGGSSSAFECDVIGIPQCRDRVCLCVCLHGVICKDIGTSQRNRDGR